MVKRFFYLLLFWVFWAIFVPTGSAQTIQWLVKPNYDTISHLNGSIFKCKTAGRVQLINTKGEELLTSLADSVTNYSENLALVLDKSGKKLKIRGIINESGNFTRVYDELFANKYSYYSEGLVSVTAPSGKAGYLDHKGNEVIPCQYRIARPFIKGWASVEPSKRKKQTIYINHQRQTLNIQNPHHGNVVMGSSFNSSGEALIAYYNNDNAIINTQGMVVRDYKRKENVTPIRTYDFSFDESGKNSFANPDLGLSFDSELLPFTSNQLMGYKKTNRVVVPPQFTWAEQFANDCAIICQKNKFGIVKLVEGSFSGTFDGDDLVITTGKTAPSYIYSLAIPESLDPDALQVMFDIGDGNMQTVDLKNNKYEFTPFVEKSTGICEMKMQVLSDGLLLWSDSMEKSVMSVNLDISSPIALSEKANDQDLIRIQSVITNNSASPIAVSVNFSAKFGKESNSIDSKAYSSATIAPKAQKEFYVDLKVLEAESVKVSVSVRANQKQFGTKSSTIELKPFY